MLKTCQALFARELAEDELRFWVEFLRDFSVAELRYAFDNWTRNGRFFPKPKDIADQCEAYRASQVKALGYPGCDALCKARHFKGYGANDMKWLLKRYFAEIQGGGNKSPLELLDELDSKREGGAPIWRQRCIE